MNNNNKDKLQLLIVCMLFGTIGTLSRFIDMPSSVICFGRAALGAITIAIILKLRKQRIDWKAIRSNLILLVLIACCMCFNWVSQFEAFRYTTIATATLCYYMEPIFFILGSALFYHEKLSPKKLVCVAVAFVGMIFVSGVIQNGFDLSEMKGALFGICGAFFYATVVLLNKRLKNIATTDSTMAQLAITAILMLPYIMIRGEFDAVKFTTVGIICLLVLGIVHTGIAYVFYFDAVKKLDSQTVGILSYIDPVEAVLLSAFFLKEPITVYTIIGAVLILGATAVSELGIAKK